MVYYTYLIYSNLLIYTLTSNLLIYTNLTSLSSSPFLCCKSMFFREAVTCIESVGTIASILHIVRKRVQCVCGSVEMRGSEREMRGKGVNVLVMQPGEGCGASGGGVT